MSREKVCLFIDYGCLFEKQQSTGKIDFRLLRDWLIGDRYASVCRFYCGFVSRDEERRLSSFLDVLRRLQFEVSTVLNSRSSASNGVVDPVIGGSIHCQISWDMCDLALTGRYDTFILVTSSGSLTEIVTKTIHKGIDVELSFQINDCDQSLRGRATTFRNLDLNDFKL